MLSKNKSTLFFISMLICACIVGCRSIGSELLPTYREGYNIALLRSEEEQLLLNIVRMQFGDRPYFLGVDSVTTSNTLSMGLSGSYNHTRGGTTTTTSSSIQTLSNFIRFWGLVPTTVFSDQPTLSYKPLQGAIFTTQVLKTITLARLYLLLQADWSFSRVFRVAIDRIGPYTNGKGSTRPSVNRVPPKDYEKFITLVNTIEELENKNLLSAHGELRDGNFVIALKAKKFHKDNKVYQKLLSMLNIKRWTGVIFLAEEHIITKNPLPGPVVVVKTRSFMSMLYYLSNAVQVTSQQINEGLVVIPRYPDGRLFDWNKVTHGIIMVHQSAICPRDTSVAVYYHGRCYYIANNDSDSKQTMALIEQIFSLAAGEIKGQTPVLTVPVR